MGYVWVFATVVLTVYGQLVFKWQVDLAGGLPAGGTEKLAYIVRLFLNPWVISVFAAALLASVTWAAALTRFELSFAYPFMSLSFVLVLLLSVVFLSEALTLSKAVGVALIVAGLIVGSQS
jgi:multidrug transporter EmrE-like cation transporter